ncbi:hatching enzyme 1.2-like [Menidia menidia]
MTPVLLFILILSVMDVSVAAPASSEEQSDEFPEIADMLVEPKIQLDQSAGLDGPEDDSETPRLEGDIAIPDALTRNADPCTARGCKWPKTGGYVYVPYTISSQYSCQQRDVIVKGLESFHNTTCVRFVPRLPEHKHYISIFSGSGCWSYLGRLNGAQKLSLRRNGCLHQSIVQHELLHALGFNHEQVRSDRDRYVRILWDNIQPGREHNFKKKKTNNLQTPYDFGSVMEYSNKAFSKNNKPTIVSKANPNLKFGYARRMSQNDILRVNRLYGCK